MAQDRPIEIQIRTEDQQLWAQLSERLSDSIDRAIKYGGGDSVTQKLLTAFSSGFENIEELEMQRDTAGAARNLKQVLRELLELVEELVLSRRKGGK